MGGTPSNNFLVDTKKNFDPSARKGVGSGNISSSSSSSGTNGSKSGLGPTAASVRISRSSRPPGDCLDPNVTIKTSTSTSSADTNSRRRFERRAKVERQEQRMARVAKTNLECYVGPAFGNWRKTVAKSAGKKQWKKAENFSGNSGAE